MAYKSIIVKLLRELEEDTVITNPKGQSRTLLRKLLFKSAYWLSKFKERFSRAPRAGTGQ